MRKVSGLKPQDILVALKLIALEGKSWKQMDLAGALGLSQTEIVFSLERLKAASLMDSEKQKPMRSALVEFLIHGLKYVYPAKPGPLCRGIPTAHCAEPLIKHFHSNKDHQYVWEYGEGSTRGQSIEPLYSTVPFAIKTDPRLYELLALVDAIRVGRARERKLAEVELKKRILG